MIMGTKNRQTMLRDRREWKKIVLEDRGTTNRSDRPEAEEEEEEEEESNKYRNNDEEKRPQEKDEEYEDKRKSLNIFVFRDVTPWRMVGSYNI
jgi:hypothetical protein